jgi:uncharacterized RDD family membrane protein YckC
VSTDANFEYVGFWIRVGAALIDTVWVLLATVPLVVAIYGWEYFDLERTDLFAGPADLLVSYVLPAAAVIAFWVLLQATPGKMVFGAKVVDARTGAALTVPQSIGRYLGYFASTIPLGLGLIWVAFDPRKQGWHDKLAGTVVIRARMRGPVPVTFERK